MSQPDELSDEDFNDLDSLTIDELRADEERHDAELNRLPVRCIVTGHDWHPRTRYCVRCGQYRYDEIGGL
jgi:hypothetical protein